MRICIIADQVYKSGGIERVLSHRINYWIDEGFEVHLITSINNNKKPYFDYNPNLVHHDLSGGFNKSVSLFSPSNLSLLPGYFLKLKKILDATDPDIIIMTNYSYEYYLIPLISTRSYLIKEYHSSFKNGKGFVNFLKNAYSKLYDNHIFLSEEEKGLSTFDNSIVIPNPISNTSNEATPLSERDKVIIAAGRMTSIKGFDRLLNSWSQIAKNHPDWRLEIYGDGEHDYIDLLNDIIKNNDISNNTFIHASLPNITDKMLNSRIYAMTSLTECFPMVLLESMQAKMAIISYNCPTGPRNILKNNETGILVNNSDEFTIQLDRLIRDDLLAQKLAEAAYIDVQKYSIHNVMNSWNQLIKQGLNK